MANDIITGGHDMLALTLYPSMMAYPITRYVLPLYKQSSCHEGQVGPWQPEVNVYTQPLLVSNGVLAGGLNHYVC